MPVTDTQRQDLEAQVSFLGGMVQVGEPGPTAYRNATNIIVREGIPQTRPGVKRAFSIDQSSMVQGFYFNQGDAKYNDTPPISFTGFWFPFDFVLTAWAGTIQAAKFVRFVTDEDAKLLFIAGGQIYLHSEGYATPVNSAVTISSTGTYIIEQAFNYAILFLDEDTNPLWWDGDLDGGFVEIPDYAGGVSGIQSRPFTADGVYMAGRIWAYRDRDNLFASDLLDFTAWDYVNHQFAINRGDGDEVVRLYPFHDGTLIIFKAGKRGQGSVHAVTGITAPSTGATGSPALSVAVIQLAEDAGLVARNAVVTVGEQVWYLAYKGIIAVQRTDQNRFMGLEVPISASIQPTMDRINWTYAPFAVAIDFKNYVLFAVPIDGSTFNNAILVWDKLANDYNGAWVSIWQAPGYVMSPLEFFSVGDKLFFLGYDGVVREMFVEYDWRDSLTPEHDIPVWDITVQYRVGEISLKSGRCFKAIRDNLGKDPQAEYTGWPDPNPWTEIEDLQQVFMIQSEVELRFFNTGDPLSHKRLGRIEVAYRHMDPKFTVAMRSRDNFTVSNIFEDVEHDRTAYDVAGVDDWDTTNVNLDHDDPYREDYTVYIYELTDPYPTIQGDGLYNTSPVDGGLWIGPEGWYVGTYEFHSVRFIHRKVDDTETALIITNKRGTFGITGVRIASESQRHAWRTR